MPLHGAGLIAVGRQHEPGCSWDRDPARAAVAHCDAAKRIADTYMLHRTAGTGLGLTQVGKVFAARLDDGTSDGTLYDTRPDAIRHQHHNERFFAYYRIGREPMHTCNAASVLEIHRQVYRAAGSGLSFLDRDEPTFGAELIPRLTLEDNHRMLAAAMAGTWIPGRTRT